MSKTQTPEYRREYWKKWYSKNKSRHIANNAKYNKEKRIRVKQILSDMKLEKGCGDCGYNKHPEALEYDHISDDKEFSVSRAIATGYGMEKILKEIAKCELVCANCHRIRTFNRRSNTMKGIHGLL